MRLVLDANEYIFALANPWTPSRDLVALLGADPQYDVRIVRILVEEVLKNSPERSHRRFFSTLDLILEDGCGIDEDFLIPYARGEHFREVGFKEADALIAAYAEAVGADVLVSENRRHFHTMSDRLPFRVMDAERFIKLNR